MSWVPKILHATVLRGLPFSGGFQTFNLCPNFIQISTLTQK